MEQRPLRLGDIVDDYCTRERRVTNHAIVAVVENTIRQTRCTTCDAEHAYKGGKEPRLRKKPQESALYDQVLAEVTGAEAQPSKPDPVVIADAEQSSETNAESPVDDIPTQDEPMNGEPPAGEFWPAHRRLIRATLPRTDNEPPVPRPIPEFTMHRRPPTRPGGRGFRFRGNGTGNGPSPNGFGPGHSSGRPGRHRGKKRR
jgi:hypothetical protein